MANYEGISSGFRVTIFRMIFNNSVCRTFFGRALICICSYMSMDIMINCIISSCKNDWDLLRVFFMGLRKDDGIVTPWYTQLSICPQSHEHNTLSQSSYNTLTFSRVRERKRSTWGTVIFIIIWERELKRESWRERTENTEVMENQPLSFLNRIHL